MTYGVFLALLMNVNDISGVYVQGLSIFAQIQFSLQISKLIFL